MHRVERPTTKRAGLPQYAAAILPLLALLLLPAAARAQWTQPDANGNISSTNSGNVGIGTTAPVGKLDVQAPSTATPLILFRQGSAAGEAVQLGVFNAPGSSGSTISNVARLMAGTNGVSSTASYIEFQPINTNGSGWASGLSVKAGGFVGVGTASPAAKLHLSAGSGEALRFTTTGNSQGAGSQVGVSTYGDSTGGAIYLGPNFYLSSGGALSRYDTSSAAWGFGFDNRPSVDAAKFFRVSAAGVITTPFMISGGGNVGVGTASPNASLNVAFTPPAGVPAAGAGAAINGLHLSSANGSFGLGVGLLSNGNGWLQAQQETTSATTYNLLLQPNGGSVGIGTPTPDTNYKLDVEGDVKVSGNISAKFQDVAEWVPSTQKLSAGTVVVLDTKQTNHVVASMKAYDTGVAGVVSDTPGVILGPGGADKLKVATTGRVKVRVDATRAPIKVGDLLVTSGEEGVAMKSVPVDLGGVQIHRPGTIIGKALEPLAGGTGEILVLLSLQ
jgi:hypothetical protein